MVSIKKNRVLKLFVLLLLLSNVNNIFSIGLKKDISCKTDVFLSVIFQDGRKQDFFGLPTSYLTLDDVKSLAFYIPNKEDAFFYIDESKVNFNSNYIVSCNEKVFKTVNGVKTILEFVLRNGYTRREFIFQNAKIKPML